MNEIGKALVAQYYQALADLDVEAFLSLHQDDVVYNGAPRYWKNDETEKYS